MKQIPSAKADQFGPEETARRRDEALLRALSTPHKLHSEMKLSKRKGKAGTKGEFAKKALAVSQKGTSRFYRGRNLA